MTKGRLEAFSDGVIAIIITIMVLELRVPHGSDWAALQPLLPVFLAYILSFIYIGIYWNNHHHMFHLTDHINGGILWANLHLLFWLSLVPFVTGWMGENHFEALPTAIYGVRAARQRHRLPDSADGHHLDAGQEFRLAAAVKGDIKGRVSPRLVRSGDPAGLSEQMDRRCHLCDRRLDMAGSRSAH